MKKAQLPDDNWALKYGAPYRSRTCGLPLRRGTLYPAELREQQALLGFAIIQKNTNKLSDYSQSSICLVSKSPGWILLASSGCSMLSSADFSYTRSTTKVMSV